MYFLKVKYGNVDVVHNLAIFFFGSSQSLVEIFTNLAFKSTNCAELVLTFVYLTLEMAHHRIFLRW